MYKRGGKKHFLSEKNSHQPIVLNPWVRSKANLLLNGSIITVPPNLADTEDDTPTPTTTAPICSKKEGPGTA